MYRPPFVTLFAPNKPPNRGFLPVPTCLLILLSAYIADEGALYSSIDRERSKTTLVGFYPSQPHRTRVRYPPLKPLGVPKFALKQRLNWVFPS